MKTLSSLLEKYTSYFSFEDCYLQIPLIFVERMTQLHLKLVIHKMDLAQIILTIKMKNLLG
jgi:hypothetical protein